MCIHNHHTRGMICMMRRQPVINLQGQNMGRPQHNGRHVLRHCSRQSQSCALQIKSSVCLGKTRSITHEYVACLAPTGALYVMMRYYRRSKANLTQAMLQCHSTCSNSQPNDQCNSGQLMQFTQLVQKKSNNQTNNVVDS